MSTSAESTRSVVTERVFRHAPEKVWRALTESPLLSQWLMKNDFEPKVGKKFQFRADPVPNWDGVIDCEVKVVEPMKQLSYSWGTMGMGTMVLWTLTPWSRQGSAKISRRTIKARNMAGRSFSARWRKFWRVCNENSQ
jgi:uncharacterized protein YndB with AHSA1/START domain